eukprot:9643549-Ditylum_brightwellii.AAC.1
MMHGKEKDRVDTSMDSVDVGDFPIEITATFHNSADLQRESFKSHPSISCPWLCAAETCMETVEKTIASSRLFNHKDNDEGTEKDIMALLEFNEIDLGRFL